MSSSGSHAVTGARTSGDGGSMPMLARGGRKTQHRCTRSALSHGLRA
jgi:hypothetical protein